MSTRNAAQSATEWPTWALIAAVYAAWLGAVAGCRLLGPLAGSVLLALACCWYISLQHELLHGHPTRSARLNRWLGLLPLAAWYPYDLYRETHLAHHRDELLTQPGIDPESNYVDAAHYARLSRPGRWLRHAQRTVLGWVLLGPALVIVPTWLDMLRRPLRGDCSQLGRWAPHLALLAGLLWLLDRQAGVGPLQYLLGVCYPALGLAMLRSFYEHRPSAEAAHRVVVNEAGWFWRWLFLNNNYHAVHHAQPALPWWRIRRVYLAQRAEVLARNGGFLVPGYGSLLRRHALRPIDSPVHRVSP